MLSTVAVHGYRSLRDIVLPLGRLTVLTGANGTGKSSVYRALRLLSDCGRGEIVAALAREGGLQSALWAGAGTKQRTVELKLGYAADDFGYLVDLGLPQMAGSNSKFGRDPEIKREVVFAGPVPRSGATLVRRAGPLAQACADDSRGFDDLTRALPTYHSVLAEFAHPGQTPELAAVRDRLRAWRFYDGFRVDAEAPARRAAVGTRSPVLADDGHNFAAAVQTVLEAGYDDLPRAVAEAFPGASITTSVNDGYFDVELQQPGVLRPLRSAELSDGTLRFLLWATALCSPQPPSLMVLNEPETSLHPDLAQPLAGLIRGAAERTQVFVVTHSRRLLEHLGAQASVLELVKESGQTLVAGQGLLDAPPWQWGSR
ncbi:AAA family ATPase [[Mycobacterium] wendilense]|uniref:AAA family ATPase n=1 Tax=[Mycobacterium] wendilense TaxID=3064284 RepID=A0ABN9P7J8_9MYCO|nr:AAA family ATPase [Mycolicibacterium sp. MU0050]CAJ1584229.1 AAA family ATPase [Mycolicibacterium sp. MU0050]